MRALDETPFVPDDVMDLALWMAGYYPASPGDALGAALPPSPGSRASRSSS